MLKESDERFGQTEEELKEMEQLYAQSKEKLQDTTRELEFLKGIKLKYETLEEENSHNLEIIN